MRYARRSTALAVVAAVVAAVAAHAAATEEPPIEPWPQRYVNNQPAAGDLVLPMPCGGSMVFRRVDIPSKGVLDDRKIIVGTRDDQRAYVENPRTAYVSAPFTDGTKEAKRYYYMGKYEVTALQAAAFEPTCPKPDDDGWLPKVNVTWAEASLLAERYSDWLLRNAADKLPKSDGAPAFVRLPTEIEWEYAARGGSAVSPTDFQARLPPMSEPPAGYIWYGAAESSNRQLNVTGLLKPNPLGLHDMLGNAAELTLDAFRFDRVGRLHGRAGGFVKRGGDYRTPLDAMHTGLREEFAPLDGKGIRREPTTGFRFVLATPAITSLEELKEVRDAWAELAANPPDELELGRDQADPVAEAKVLADAAPSAEMKRRLLNLAQVIEVSIATRNDERERAAREMLRAATFGGRRFLDYFPRLERCKELLAISEDSRKRNGKACADTEEAFRFDANIYIQMLTRLAADYPGRILSQQGAVLRAEFDGMQLAMAGHTVDRVREDVEMIRKDGSEARDRIVDRWRTSPPR